MIYPMQLFGLTVNRMFPLVIRLLQQMPTSRPDIFGVLHPRLDTVSGGEIRMYPLVDAETGVSPEILSGYIR